MVNAPSPISIRLSEAYGEGSAELRQGRGEALLSMRHSIHVPVVDVPGGAWYARG